MPKRTRERQLAKLAARRQAERAAVRRRRNLVLGLIAGALAVILLIVGASILFAGNEPTSTASGSASGSASTISCDTVVPPAADESKPTFAKAPKSTIDPTKTYTATIDTSCGTIDVELLPKIAPIGVNNFVFLAQKGFYDGLTFHRIVKDFVIQGGDPKGDGSGGPGYQFPIETSKEQTFDSPGLLAYANSGPDTNGSQFFITLSPQPSLDPGPNGSYTIFGRVTKGMNVVTAIGDVPTVAGPGCPQGEQCSPSQPVYIDSVVIAES